MPRFDVPVRKRAAIFIRSASAGRLSFQREPYNVVSIDYGDGSPIQTYVEPTCCEPLSRGTERQEVYDEVRIYDAPPFPGTRIGYGGPGQ